MHDATNEFARCDDAGGVARSNYFFATLNGIRTRVIDRTATQTRRLRIQFSSSDGSVCTRHVMTEWLLISIRVRAIRTACVPHCSLAVTSSFDHGSKAQATETSRQYPRPAGCDHRDFGSREGTLEPDTGQGRFWFRQNPSEDDQGMFLLSSDASVPGSHLTRTPWPTNPTTSIWG